MMRFAILKAEWLIALLILTAGCGASKSGVYQPDGSEAASTQPSPSPTPVHLMNVSSQSVYTGATVQIDVVNTPSTTGDWIALAAVGSAIPSYISRQYLNGSSIPPASGIANATMAFTMPQTEGQYEFRLFENDSSALLATSVVISVVAPPTSSEMYSFFDDFSSTQGFHGWSYLESSGVPLAYQSDDYWHGSETYLLINNNILHPGNDVDAIVRWVAPLTGQIQITGGVADANFECGDGVSVRIDVDGGTTLWSWTIDNADSTTYTFDISLDIRAGQAVNLTLNSRGDNGCDSTSLAETIVLVAPE
jgi:hypothetical protein